MVGGRNEQPVGRRYRRRAALRMASVTGALCAGVLGLLSGCAGLIGTHDVDISESQLTVLMARQFPMERKVMEVIDLNITNPVLTLIDRKSVV